MLPTTRTKITLLFASIVAVLILLLNLIIFDTANNEWQSRKTSYMHDTMVSQLSTDEAKIAFPDLQIEDNSGTVLHKQGLFTHAGMEHEGIGSWFFPDSYITKAQGRYYYWGIETMADGYIYKTIDDVSDIIMTRDMIIERALWTSALGFLLLIVIGYIFSGYILRPIQNMNEATKKFSLSEKIGTHHVGIYGNIKDEVVILARSLEDLFDRVNKEAERLEQFSDDIAHEIKNRLFEIMSSLDIALTAKDPKENIVKSKSILKQLSSVVDALLFFARNDVKDPEKKDIKKLLENSLGSDDVRIHIVEDEPVTVPLYPELFITAVGNIVGNALKFTPQDGTVTLTVSKKSLTITDTGIGISKKDIAHIFDRLYKVDKVRTPGSGHGLGLSISKKILEDLHGFSLSVTSSEGKGTTFIIDWNVS